MYFHSILVCCICSNAFLQPVTFVRILKVTQLYIHWKSKRVDHVTFFVNLLLYRQIWSQSYLLSRKSRVYRFKPATQLILKWKSMLTSPYPPPDEGLKGLVSIHANPLEKLRLIRRHKQKRLESLSLGFLIVYARWVRKVGYNFISHWHEINP